MSLHFADSPDEDDYDPLGWWTISGTTLLTALKRVDAGEPPDLVYAELYANAEVHMVECECEICEECEEEYEDGFDGGGI